MNLANLYHILSDIRRDVWQQDILYSPAKMFQIRAHDLTALKKIKWAEKLNSVLRKKNALLLINMGVEDYLKHSANLLTVCAGVHWTEKALEKASSSFNENLQQILAQKKQQPIIAASCHDLSSINLANQLKLDFITLSPVNSTFTHPDAKPLGWTKFSQLAKRAKCPVYALGGVGQHDLKQAKQYGAHGVAGIRSFYT